MLGPQPSSSVVPIGEPWREEEDTEPKPVPAEADKMDTEQGEGEDGSGSDEGNASWTPQKNAVPAEDERFDGDRVLMRSAHLMYEALVSREVAQAVAEGDIGRVYEGVKVSHQLDSVAAFLLGIAYAVHIRGVLAQQVYQLPA